MQPACENSVIIALVASEDSGEGAHMCSLVRVFSAHRALDHPILGPKFGTIPNAKKYVFFPIPDKKFPI